MLKSHLVRTLALTLTLGAVPALAQQTPAPEQQPPARAAQPAPIRGELVSVDADAKTITVKASDANVTFSYNDKTEVTGAKDGAAGLATMKEAQVTVHFTENAQAKTKLATRIIVEPRQ